jgi:2-methylcitrate dehydratase PrpD
LNPVQFEHAFGIASSLASGNRQCIADGALSKRLQAEFAARDGILAVQLTLRGLTGCAAGL